MVTRAVHLELVQDMTTEEFLLAFKHFIAQRGTPVEIISDNAAIFKLARDVEKCDQKLQSAIICVIYWYKLTFYS